MPHFSLKFSFLALGVVALFALQTILYLPPLSQWLWAVTPSVPVAYVTTALNPRDITLQEKIGRYFFNHGAYDINRAKAAYERVLALDPESLPAHYQLGRIEFLRGDFFRAIRYIDRVLALDPDFAKGYYMRGLILGYRGDLNKAVEAFQEYVRRVPHEWAGYNDLAWLHFQLGEYEETLAVTTDGLKVGANNAWLLNMHGLALLNLNRKDEARTYFEQAKERADQMQPADWGIAYPGNDPAIYAEGLERMREAIEHNLDLVQQPSLGSPASK